MEFKHIPVLLDECMEALELKDNAIYVDCTLGGAGHTNQILSKTKNTTVVGIDLDTEALESSKKRLGKLSKRVTFVHDNFKNISNILKNLNIEKVDGILVDLGVSSYQLDNGERGFSYNSNATLDMRMNQEQPKSAYQVVNTYSFEDLKRIIKEYGEERYAQQIARKIESARQLNAIQTTGELKQIILSSVPRFKGSDPMGSVQRTFQAIRIEVNGELAELKEFLIEACNHLKVGGRLAVISFHSLEDRIVKQTFKDLSTNCICPPDFPICVCGHKAKAKLIGKFIVATEEEKQQNRRSSSAKLRTIEKI